MATKKQPTSVPLAPLKSAGDQRAEAMEWNEHDRDARVRMARALRACRAHYRKVLPHHWRFMVRSFKKRWTPC